MASESGFSNQKKLGIAQYKTIQSLGSDKFGAPVASRGLFDVSGADQAIVNVDTSNDLKYIYIEVTAHGARVNDVFRLTTGNLSSWEFPIEEVVDVDIIKVLNVCPSLPVAGDDGRVHRWITPGYSSDGGLAVSVPTAPAQFIYNGGDQQVVQDTATPANNRAMPNLLFIYKDGVEHPITKDTGTPANTLGIPVEIVAASGTPINITAGDINVQLTDVGVNFDAVRVGDGSGIYLDINADGSINVVGPLTDAELRAAPIEVDTGLTQGLTDAELRATPVEVDTGLTQPLTDAQLRASPVEVDTGLTQGLTDAELRATPVDVDTGLTQPLTDAQLRASPVEVDTGLVQGLTDAELRAAPIETTQTALTGSYQEDLTVTDGAVETFTAPAEAKWCKIQADDTNTGNLRVKIGAAATTTSGIQLQPGRSEDFQIAGNISYTMEAGATGKIYVQFGA